MRNISIILVSPQMGENIGASARAMKNFGLLDLRIVDPRDGWPNPVANANSVGAIDIIQNAKIYRNLCDAVHDLNYLYATTAQSRNMNKDYVQVKRLKDQMQIDCGDNIGIIFGRESSGLTNSEIAIANKIITIDVNHNFSSLNLSHAVAIVCYEMFKAVDLINSNIQKLATKEELHYFYNHLFTELEMKNFFKVPEKEGIMKQNIINIFSRINTLSHSEIQTLRGIITSLSFRG